MPDKTLIWHRLTRIIHKAEFFLDIYSKNLNIECFNLFYYWNVETVDSI